ncbi:IPT/TIG domain-containing protein, partial [Rhodopseudomonas palustris]
MAALAPSLSWAASAGCNAVNGGALNYTVSFSTPDTPDDGQGYKSTQVTGFATGDIINYSVTINPTAGSIEAGFLADFSFGIPTGFNNNTGGGFSSSVTGQYQLTSIDVSDIDSTSGLYAEAFYGNFQGFTGSVSLAATCTAAGTPAVTAVAPSSGPTAGGTSVTITGTNFTGATSVSFGATSVPSSSFTSSSGTQIVVPSPAGSAGTVHVTVTNATGTSPTNSNDQFTYVAAPTIGTISPSSGPVAGGTSVTITGTNL